MTSPAAIRSEAEQDGRRFRRTAGRLPTGVTLLGTVTGGEPHGMTVNSFTTVSMRPLLVLVSVGVTARLYPRLCESGVYAVSVLAVDQEQLARWFADRNRPEGGAAFAGMPWQPTAGTGSPVLTGSLGYFDCTITDRYDVGDHGLFVGRVEQFAELRDADPLVFVGGRYLSAAGSPPAGAPSDPG